MKKKESEVSAYKYRIEIAAIGSAYTPWGRDKKLTSAQLEELRIAANFNNEHPIVGMQMVRQKDDVIVAETTAPYINIKRSGNRLVWERAV